MAPKRKAQTPAPAAPAAKKGGAGRGLALDATRPRSAPERATAHGSRPCCAPHRPGLGGKNYLHYGEWIRSGMFGDV